MGGLQIPDNSDDDDDGNNSEMLTTDGLSRLLLEQCPGPCIHSSNKRPTTMYGTSDGSTTPLQCEDREFHINFLDFWQRSK